LRKIVEKRVQSNIHVFTQEDKTYVRKFATSSGEFDVLEQIKLLQMLPYDIALHYPKLIDFCVDSRPYYYTMPYYELPTFRELMLYFDLDAISLLKFAKNVFAFLLEKHHTWRKTKAEANYAVKTYIDRVQNRLARIASGDGNLRDILFSIRLLVGDEELHGVLSLLTSLEKVLNQYKFFGSTIYSTHGQMEFAHILVNIQDPHCKDFILLDAKGLDEMYDPAYDIGKFWMCSHGLFDWIEESQFDIAPISVAQGKTQINFLKFRLNERQNVCHTFHHLFQEYILNAYYPNNHDQALLEFEIAAATHLLGSVDFYYDMFGFTHAVVCFIQGIRLLTAVINIL
jgi:hypothetical protein